MPSDPHLPAGVRGRFAEIVAGSASSQGDGLPLTLFAGPAVLPVDVVPVAMLVTNSAGEALTVNSKWCELSGLDHAASLGDGWLRALPPGPAAWLRAVLRRVATSGVPSVVDQPWTAAGAATAARWWICTETRASEQLVGIAVALLHPEDRPGRSLERVDPRLVRAELLRQLPNLLRSLESLLTTFEELGSPVES